MSLHKMVDGIKVNCTPQEEAEIKARWAANEAEQKKNAWLHNRKREYPKLEDQLDMLWHAMNNGEVPKANLFYKAISDIKKKFPK